MLYFGVILGVSMAIFQVSLITGVTLWFRKHLGVAIGVLQGIQGLGTVLAFVTVLVLFNTVGLKWAF